MSPGERAATLLHGGVVDGVRLTPTGIHLAPGSASTFSLIFLQFHHVIVSVPNGGSLVHYVMDASVFKDSRCGSGPRASRVQLEIGLFESSTYPHSRQDTEGQFHTFNFFLPCDDFTNADDLSTATLNTRADLGQFGRIHLTFGNAGPVRGTCDNGIFRQRRGTLDGPNASFVLKTNRNFYGASSPLVIRRRSFGATLVQSSCRGGGRFTIFCPVGAEIQSTSSQGTVTSTWFVGQHPVGHRLELDLLREEHPVLDGTAAADVFEGAFATLPRSDLSVSGTPRYPSARIEPTAGSIFKGSAHFAGDGTTPSVEGPFKCADPKTFRKTTYTDRVYQGTFVGDLLPDGSGPLTATTDIGTFTVSPNDPLPAQLRRYKTA
jgi:hypothetical protein